MKRLLIDLGNTRIKWAFCDGHEIAAVSALAHADAAWPATFSAALHESDQPDQILLSTVARELLVATLQRSLRARWPDHILQRAQSAERLGRFHSAYAEPQRLGVDRFLAAAAAARHPRAQLIIGSGTALTLDLIDAEGQHGGGLIAPTPETMRAAVLARTANVHWLRAGTTMDFATNTEDALESGSWMAAAGMVERAFRRAQTRLSVTPELIAHGGSAETLVNMLELPVVLAPNLVFEGLLMWGDERLGAIATP